MITGTTLLSHTSPIPQPACNSHAYVNARSHHSELDRILEIHNVCKVCRTFSGVTRFFCLQPLERHFAVGRGLQEALTNDILHQVF